MTSVRFYFNRTFLKLVKVQKKLRVYINTTGYTTVSVAWMTTLLLTPDLDSSVFNPDFVCFYLF